MRNRISWLIACQSVCAGTDGIRKGWGGNHEAPSPFALGGGWRWGPKELRACIRTRTHGVKQRATGARAYVCASARVRTYVLRGRLLSLSAVRAHTMHVRTYVQTRVRACDRGGDMRGHARTVRTHARGARETRT